MEAFPAIANVVDVAIAHGGSVGQYLAGMLPQAAEAMPAATEAGEVLMSQLAQGGRTVGQIMGGLAPEAAAVVPEVATAAPGMLATAGEALGAIGNVANPIADLAMSGYMGFEAGTWLAENTAAGDVATDAAAGLDGMLTGKGERSALLRASEWVDDKTTAASSWFDGMF